MTTELNQDLLEAARCYIAQRVAIRRAFHDNVIQAWQRDRALDMLWGAYQYTLENTPELSQAERERALTTMRRGRHNDERFDLYVRIASQDSFMRWVRQYDSFAHVSDWLENR